MSTVFLGGQGCGNTGTATTDDQNINGELRMVRVKPVRGNDRPGFKHIGKFVRGAVPLIRTDLQGAHTGFNIVRMKGFQKRLFGFGIQQRDFPLTNPLLPGGFQSAD